MNTIPHFNDTKYSEEISEELQNFLGEQAHRRNFLRAQKEAKQYYDGVSNKQVRDLINKIKGYIQRYNSKYTVDHILDRIIQGDEIFLTQFSVQPKRQGSSKDFGLQEFQVSRINSVLIEMGFQVVSIPTSGPKSIRIENGEFRFGVSKTASTTSSIDAVTSGNESKCIYNIMKVTHSLTSKKDKGGMQGHQLENALKGLENIDFTKSENLDKYVVVVLDGLYYQENPILFQIINKFKDNKHVYFTTSYKYQDVLRAILHN